MQGDIMKSYRATSKFKILVIDNSYQQLTIEQWTKFHTNKIVNMDNPPKHLLEGGLIEEKKINLNILLTI